MNLICRLESLAYPEKPNQVSKPNRKRQRGTAEKTGPLLSFVDGENEWKENLTGLLLVLSVYWENYCSLYLFLGG